MGLLLAGLADPSVLTPEATGDRLHQDARTALFPEAPALLAALLAAGALASCWSGAGPSLLGITTTASASTVRVAAEGALEAVGLTGTALELPVDRRGLLVGDAAEWPG
jgi:homoserine kinase